MARVTLYYIIRITGKLKRYAPGAPRHAPTY